MAIIINGSNTPTAGAVACGNGTELAFSAQGTKGQVLISNVGSAPSWSTILTADDVNYGVGVGTSVDGSALLSIGPGDAGKPPVKLASGTLATSPAAGELEYDGNVLQFVNDDSSLRGVVLSEQVFRLSAAGSAIGPAISSYFGANSAIQLAAGGIYEINYFCYLIKTTAGTVTWTVTSSAAPVNVNGIAIATAIAGTGAPGGAIISALFISTSAAAAFAASGSLTTGVGHFFNIRLIYAANASTAPNVRLNVTQSAGTLQPLQGSYYTVRRLSSANTGNFVA